MQRLLVSMYADRGGEPPCLLLVSPQDGTAERIALDLPPGTERCMGLAASGSLVYLVAAADDASHLVSLDAATGSQKGCHELPGVRDGHSILIQDSIVHVVSSGTDEVVRFTLCDDGPRDRRVVWAAGQGRSDGHHLNSLAALDGGTLVSGFGVARAQARSAPPSGFVHDITAGRRLLDAIHHPHSLTVHRGRLYYCESRTGAFRTHERVVVTLDGYLRGAAWLPSGLVCLGTSAGRPPRGEPHADARACALWIVDPTEGSVLARLPLSRFGPEIYDIIPAPDR